MAVGLVQTAVRGCPHGEGQVDSLELAELCQVDSCAVTFAACGHVAGLDFLVFCLFGFFLPLQEQTC